MATEVANAEKQARNQHKIDAHVDRISRALGFAAPPRVRADTKDARNAVESERMLNFLGLVADAVDPSNAGKFNPAETEALGGIRDGYIHTEAEQREEAEKVREESVTPQGAEQEQRDLRGQALDEHGNPVDTAATDDEPHFAGKPLSAFDNVPEEQLTEQDGVGEVTAKEIVKARRKRDRKAGK